MSEMINTVRAAWKKAVEPENKLAVEATKIADRIMDQIGAQLSAAAPIDEARSDVFEIVFENGWLKEDVPYSKMELGRLMAEAYDKAYAADKDKYVPLIFGVTACGKFTARFGVAREEKKEDKFEQLKKVLKDALAD